jgi:hypothetical protein
LIPTATTAWSAAAHGRLARSDGSTTRILGASPCAHTVGLVMG